jgi:hypothetical protein
MKLIISLATIVSLAFGAYLYIDQRYALAKTVELVALRLEQKIEADSLDINQNRLWKLEDRCQKVNCTSEEWNELRELKEQVEMQKEKLNIIQQRIIK